MLIPRFQGNAVEKDGGWSFEFLVSSLGDDTGDLYSFDTIYKTRDEAITALKIAIADAIKVISEKIPELQINPENYIDLKTNSKRRWDKRDEQ